MKQLINISLLLWLLMLVGSLMPQAVAQSDPPEALISRYDQLYRLFQGNARFTFDSLRRAGTIRWDSVQQVFLKYDSEQRKLDSTIVFGWHPSWMNKYAGAYNYNLLSHASFYAYIIDPNTGRAVNSDQIEKWKNSTFLKNTKESPGTQALLTLVNYGAGNNRTFLNNALEQQEQLINELTALLTETECQGIDLNFENIPNEDLDKFTVFVRELEQALHTENPDYTISLNLSVRDARVLPVMDLQDHVDFFVLMGYGFRTRRDNTPGPIAPISQQNFTLRNAVEQFISRGIPAEKLVLGLPYFGALWETRDSITTFHSYLSYRQIRARFDGEQPIYNIDSTDVSYRVLTDTAQFEVWFDDSTTLSKKYAFAKEQGLGGIAIWALGYDNGYFDLWGAIDQSFSVSAEAVERPLATLANRIAAFALEYKGLLIVCFTYILLFLVLGFAVALNYANVRETLFRHNTWRIIIVLSVFIAPVILWLIKFNGEEYRPQEDGRFTFAIGILGGILLTNLVYYFYGRWKARLPKSRAHDINYYKNN